jgi:hypothetical protein
MNLFRWRTFYQFSHSINISVNVNISVSISVYGVNSSINNSVKGELNRRGVMNQLLKVILIGVLIVV